MNDLLKMLAVAALYALLGKSALFFAPGGNVSIIWPASGMALAVLLIGGRRYAWSILIGAFLTNFIHNTFGTAISIATGATLGALVASWLLIRNSEFDRAIGRVYDHLYLIVAGGMGCGVAALIGVTTLLVDGFVNPENYLSQLRVWWMGDALGIILITPLILVWWQPQADRLNQRQLIEAAFIATATFLVGQAVFLDWFKGSIGLLAKSYWMFLFITLAAVRTGSRGTSITLLMVASQALYGACRGSGYFADDFTATHLYNYWYYMVILSIVGMSLAAYLDQLKQAKKSLRLSEEKLLSMFEMSPMGMARNAMDGRFIEANAAFLNIVGFSLEELNHLSYWDLTPDCFAAQEALQLESLKTTSKYGPYEKQYINRNGQRVDVRLNGVLITGSDGEQYIWSTIENVTDSKQLEAEIRLAATAFETQEGILIADADKTILRSNRAFTRITGYSAEELSGTTPTILQSGMQDDAFYQAMWQSISRDKFWAGEIWDKRKNGEIIPFWLTITADMTEDGSVRHYIATFSDLSQYKQMEQEKLELAAYNQSLIETIPDAIYLKDSLGCWRIANKAATRLFQLQHIDWQNRTDQALEAVIPQLRSVFHECKILDAKAWNKGNLVVGEIQASDDNGRLRTFEVRKAPIFDGAGKPVGLVSIGRDVTDYHQAEAALHEAVRFAQGALNALSAHIAILDDTGTIIAVNHTWRSFAKYNLPLACNICEGINYLAVCEQSSDADGAETTAMAHGIRAVMSGEVEEFTLEYSCHGPDEKRWFMGRITRFPGEGPLRVVVSHENITKLKLAEDNLKHHFDHLQDLVHEQTLELQESEAEAQRALAALEHQKFVLDQHAIVAVTDMRGRIIYANNKFCSISGYSREELLGQDHAIINSGYHPKGFFKEMYRTVARGQPWHGEICNRAKDGHLYWVDTTIAAYLGEDGKPREYIAIRTDITERMRAEKAAEAANRAKSEFLANMSHEIRTPMNGVIGMVDILKHTELSREQLRMVRTINDSAISLLTILNDILDFSKIEAGKLTLEAIPTHIQEVAEGVAQLMISTTATKHIDFHVFVSPQVPAWIMSDPVRLRQILFNLLGNAVKFTATTDAHQGLVSLRVEPTLLSDGRDGLRICVKDNGIGMSKETVESLFQPFTQADESTTRRFGGSGLGLSITKRLVDMLRGKVSVQSELGEGSEFTVELPVVLASPGYSLRVEPELTGVRVLAVTDKAILADILTRYLQAAGAEIHVAPDNTAVYQQLSSWPNAVLLRAPEMAKPVACPTGTGMSNTTRGVQLIHRSTSGNNEKDVTVPVGPLFFHDLIQGVAIASGRFSAQETSHERRQLPRTTAPTADEARAGGRLILLAEDNETNREVIQEQLRILGYASEAAVDGQQALEWWRKGTYALLLTDCHMPKMDGFELTAAIRAEEADNQHLPIIAVTANAIQGEAEHCLANGMDDYLSKPLQLNELGPMLAKWLPRSESPEAMVMDNSDLSEPSAELVIWDNKVLPNLVGDNPELHRRLLDKFLVSAEEMVAALAAATIQEAPSLVADVAHKLKSAARTVGAMQLAELAQTLEIKGRGGDMAAIRPLAQSLPVSFQTAAELIKKG